MVSNENIGELIKKIRTKKGISQRRLSLDSGLSREYIYQLESGKKTKSITTATAQKLAKGLGVRPEIFLSADDSEFLYYYPHVFEAFVKEVRATFSIAPEDDNKKSPGRTHRKL